MEICMNENIWTMICILPTHTHSRLSDHTAAMVFCVLLELAVLLEYISCCIRMTALLEYLDLISAKHARSNKK